MVLYYYVFVVVVVFGALFVVEWCVLCFSRVLWLVVVSAVLSAFATWTGCFVHLGGVFPLIVVLILKVLDMMLVRLPRCLGIPAGVLLCLLFVVCDAVRSNSIVLSVFVVDDFVVVEDERVVVMLCLLLFCTRFLFRGG